MNHKITLLLAAIMAVASCQKQETGSKETYTGPVTIKFSAKASDTKALLQPSENSKYIVEWQKSDRVGLSADMSNPMSVDITLSEDKRSISFSAYLRAPAKEYCAFVPYSAYTMGTEMNTMDKSVKLKVPAEQTPRDSSPDAKAQLMYAYTQPAAGAKEVNLTFGHALAYGVLKLSNLDLKGASINSVTLTAGTPLAGGVSLSFDSGILTTVDGTNEILLRTSLADNIWFACIPADLSGTSLSVKVSTTAGDQLGSVDFTDKSFRLEAGKVTVIDIDMTPGKNLKYLWSYISSIDGGYFGPQAPAIDRNGNVYFTLRATKNVYKLNSAGSLEWKHDLAFTDGASNQYTSASVEPDGSFVYAGGGRDGSAVIKKISGTDGSAAWTFDKTKFFTETGTAAPKLYRVTPAIGDKCIYIDNGGTTGTIVSIDKSTGERVAYLAEADGATAPVGGVSESGVSISKAGVIGGVAKWGHYAVNQSEMDNPSLKHDTFGGYVPFGYHYGYKYSGSPGINCFSNWNSGVAATTVKGVNSFAYFRIEQVSSTECNGYVIATDAAKGLGTSAPDPVLDASINHKIANIAPQGEGGIVVGEQKELIVSLRNTNGKEGGIYAVNEAGEMAYKFTDKAIDVNGGPAVDNLGNIHFMTTYGEYFIVKPNYDTKSCELKSIVNIYSLLQESDVDMSAYSGVEGWTTVMIGYDGKIYLGTNLIRSAGGKHGAVICLEYKNVTGPSASSPWPMRGGDCSHTGRQK